MTVNLSDQDKATIRTAAFGAITLLSFADVAGSPHKVATHGTLALNSATGLVGHVLSAKSKDFRLQTKSGAVLADQVFPALAASVTLLDAHDPAEADNFRATIAVALDAAARAGSSVPSAPLTEMIRKITEVIAVA
ncbi:hypothetical protein AB0I28_22150 [Phytomonospora sp. NPDC050363]|uniref:hypothetical protein n=1 Tax=Phytomonospora sp. NPDC050363 TaxID=3155642 RepID=UPI0033DBCE6D